MTAEEALRIRDTVTTLCAAGRLDDARDLLEREGPALPDAVRLECRGTLHFHRRELQLAVDLYEAAIRADPRCRIARYQYLVGTQCATRRRDGPVSASLTRGVLDSPR